MNKEEILEQLSKKCTVVSYKNKEKRKSFDETFGRRKMELALKVIGDNSDILLEKLNKKEPEKKGWIICQKHKAPQNWGQEESYRESWRTSPQ